MAPSKGNKPEINPWGWVSSTKPENVGLEQLLRTYRILDFKYCEESRRVCKRNPFCYWGLGEKKWIHGAEDGSDDEDNGFREEGEFAGLQNLGATCYVNSLLQLWYHNPILRPAILRWQPTLEHQNNEVYRPDGPIGQLQAMFARMKMSKKSKIDPREFVNALKLDTGEQQDAQEFSKLFMEVILRQMLTAEYADGAIVRDAVASAFRGELQNENECTECRNKTQRQESFNELELGVMKNLNESLDELLKDERLTDSNQYYCSICKRKNDAIRRTQLLKLPPVLNLQLMRFVFDRETCRKKKVNTTIQFPEVLDMSTRVHQTAANNSISNEALVYHLSAVLVHNGPSASSGHYVAQIKDLRTGIWHKFNDENVDPVANRNNAKSRKLILKEDEGSGSDNEKTKQKKGKAAALAPGFHSSQGAYMLVYTLERYVKEPESDPEPWPYLQKMIKREDEEYEEEMKKTKNEKDYDNNLKEQRKREIAALYPSLQLNKKVENKSSEEADNDSGDDFQPPKKKMARTDHVVNGISKHVVDVSNRNGNGFKKEGSPSPPPPNTNGVVQVGNNNGTKITKKMLKKHENQEAEQSMAAIRNLLSPLQRFDASSSEAAVSNVHFISSEWLQQWLDAVNPPPPIENKDISCEHGLLSPTLPGIVACKYKAIPSNFADELYQHYTIDGEPFKGAAAFCLTCVQRECQRMRKLNELENDYKIFADTNKKLESILAAKEKSGELGDPSSWGSNLFWLSKDVIRNWKRFAKADIEQEFNGNADSSSSIIVDGDAETQEDDSDPSSLLPFNSELLCPHDNLIPNATLRKIIPETSWEIVQRYFPTAVPIWVVEKLDCIECMNAEQGDNVLRNMNKQEAQKQRSQLLDLYLGRSRPNVAKIGTLYAISYDFFSRWKKFIKEPTKNDSVMDVNNKSLLCSMHEKFMYPLKYHDEVINIKPEEEKFCLVHPKEWNVISEIFSIDTEIEIQVKSSDEVQYNPDVCDECSTEWWLQSLQQKFNYTKQPIHIIRREKPSTEEQQSDDEDLFTLVTKDKDKEATSSKRLRKQHNPSSWATPTWSAAAAANPPKPGVRSSQRRRRPRGEKSKMYRVDSSMTLKELKIQITSGFNALLSDQHLFFGGQELQDDKLSLTLGELQIPAEATLYLEIDTMSKQDDDDPNDRPALPENGFFGTLLLNNSPTSSPSPSSSTAVVIDDFKSS